MFCMLATRMCQCSSSGDHLCQGCACVGVLISCDCSSGALFTLVIEGAFQFVDECYLRSLSSSQHEHAQTKATVCGCF
jgi:hypothetical protein